MNIRADIIKTPYPFEVQAGSSGTVDGSFSGEVYVCIYDVSTNQPTNGGNAWVSYREIINGILGPVKQVPVPGQSTLIYQGVLQSGGESPFTYDAIVTGITFRVPVSVPDVDDDTPPSTGNTCDAVINEILINQPESDFGAADGQITINAKSSYLPVQYSLDNDNWQTSPIFSQLTAGGYVAYITDARGCSASKSFNVTAAHKLLIGDPSVNLGNGNISRWNAAFNPVVFTYQRKDCGLTRMERYSDTETLLTLNADVSKISTGDIIYLNTSGYAGSYQVTGKTGNYNQLIVSLPYQSGMTGAAGFINANSLRPYYHIVTQISYQDPLSGQQQTIQSTNRPDNTGLIKADLSSFLQSLLRAQDDSNFTQLNYRDYNLSASYNVAYAEVWDGNNDDLKTRSYISISTPYYMVYAAKQLGEAYGGNLAAYVPFKSVIQPAQLARWVTDFTEPAYSEGYPFDISFIYGEDLAGLDIQCEIIQLDINRKPLSGGSQTTYLLNENGSFLLNLDGSRLIINRGVVADATLAQHVGLNRLLITGGFAPQAAYFTLALNYGDEHGNHTITQTQAIRIDNAVDDQSVYLRWIGLSGSWNYYRFVYNQEISLDVQNAVIVKRFVSDWQNQDGIEDVLSKSAGQKMKVMAEDLSVNDIKGLQSLKYSPKVQMLVNHNPVTWQTVVLNTATFDEYETRYGQAAFSVMFNLPSINIQTQ